LATTGGDATSTGGDATSTGEDEATIGEERSLTWWSTMLAATIAEPVALAISYRCLSAASEASTEELLEYTFELFEECLTGRYTGLSTALSLELNWILSEIFERVVTFKGDVEDVEVDADTTSPSFFISMIT
jgi:hypothetical protein